MKAASRRFIRQVVWGSHGFVLLCSALAGAAPPESQFTTSPELFKIEGKTLTMVRVAEQKLLVDRLCWSHAEACGALRALPRASLEAVRSELTGGADPGAVVCLHLGGQSVIGTDENHNENSFCRFGDRSLISSGSLHAHARSNDQRKH